MTAIELNNVTKRYGAATALSGVSLTVAEGEVYGFLGPNGAGKTTTIRCIMDFIRPDSGKVLIFGQDAQAGSVEVRRQIGFLPAESQLYPKWTAKQHIELISSVRGGKNSSAKLLDRLELDPKLQVRRMSTGNRQKLGLILAIMSDPKLLILDEPTTGLDPLLQHELYAIIKEYVAGGGTVFLSSHNLAEVERICTNVGVIRKGEIVASKSMAEILAMNVHTVTVTFPEGAATQNLDLAGAEVISEANNHKVLRVRGDINPLLAKLAQHKVADVEITHAPLEEIFMEYYRGKS